VYLDYRKSILSRAAEAEPPKKQARAASPAASEFGTSRRPQIALPVPVTTNTTTTLRKVTQAVPASANTRAVVGKERAAAKPPPVARDRSVPQPAFRPCGVGSGVACMAVGCLAVVPTKPALAVHLVLGAFGSVI
jgi:hypothetical protein